MFRTEEGVVYGSHIYPGKQRTTGVPTRVCLHLRVSDHHDGAAVLPNPSGPLFRFCLECSLLVGVRTSIWSSRYNLHIPVWPAGNIEVPREMQGEGPVAAVITNKLVKCHFVYPRAWTFGTFASAQPKISEMLMHPMKIRFEHTNPIRPVSYFVVTG